MFFILEHKYTAKTEQTGHQGLYNNTKILSVISPMLRITVAIIPERERGLQEKIINVMTLIKGFCNTNTI